MEWQKRIAENDRLKRSLKQNKQAGEGIDFMSKLKSEVKKVEAFKKVRNQTASLPPKQL